MRNFYVVLDYTSVDNPTNSYVGIAPTVNPPPIIIQTWPEPGPTPPDPIPSNGGLSVVAIICIVIASILSVVGIAYGVKFFINKRTNEPV